MPKRIKARSRFSASDARRRLEFLGEALSQGLRDGLLDSTEKERTQMAEYERLTEKYDSGYDLVKVKDGERKVNSPYKNTLVAMLECFQRLGEYEDTGLSPEQVAEMIKSVTATAEAAKEG